MSRFTPCKAPARHQADDFSIVEAVKVLMTLSVLVAFGLAHVGLRARLSLLRHDINSLQGAQTELLGQSNALRIGNEALKTPKSVQDYARRELGMISCDALSHETLTLPSETRAQYALARAESERAAAQAGDAGSQDEAGRLLALMSEQLGRVGLAGNAAAAVAPSQDAAAPRATAARATAN